MKKLSQLLKTVGDMIGEQRWDECIIKLAQVRKVENQEPRFVQIVSGHLCHCHAQVQCSEDTTTHVRHVLLAWDVIYTSCAYAMMSVSVYLSVTEVHWHIIANLGFKFRSQFTVHCGRSACGHEGRDHRLEEWRDHLALCCVSKTLFFLLAVQKQLYKMQACCPMAAELGWGPSPQSRGWGAPCTLVPPNCDSSG